jgi:small conductance mechanosensitive channel
MITGFTLDTQNIWVMILIRLIGAAAIFLVGRWLAGLVQRSMRALLKRTRATPALIEILARGSYYAILTLAVVLALVTLGIPINVVLGTLGIVIVVAAVALRESLRDLAATVIFIVFQPFKAGDTIETNGVTGLVQEILLFSTVLITGDHRQVVIPNGNIQSNNLVNLSALETVRLDLTVRLSYADSVQKVTETLLTIARADTRVQETPEPMVQMMSFGDSHVEYVLRVHTRWDEAWLVRPALNQRIKTCLELGQLTLPLPQLQLDGRSTLRLEQSQIANHEQERGKAP